MGEHMTPDSRSLIVVGVDGSPPSIEALRWAIQQAASTRANLRAVTAWNFPNDPTPFGVIPELPPAPDQLEQVRNKLDAVVAEVGASRSDVQVRTEVIRGHAPSVLVAAARHADLLVVGSRGRGALAEVLLGSVSEYCVRHAACPVVVVREVAHHS